MKKDVLKLNSIKIVDIHNFPKSIKNFKAKAILNNDKYIVLDHESFIPGGSINKRIRYNCTCS